MSPTRHMSEYCPSLGAITADRENIKVSVRFFGLLSFANTIPPIKLCKITLKLA
jgi:hypothetical protein